MPYQKKFDGTLYNQDWLQKLYVEQQQTATHIGWTIGCDRSAVLRQLRRFNIPVRTNSEAQKLAPHPGSHAPRPRGVFANTLHNPSWLKEAYETNGFNATEVSRLAGSSIPSAIEALQKAGIYVEGISHAKIGRPRINGRKPDEELSLIACQKRARMSVPPGPCAVCGRPGEEVNHKDRNKRNYHKDNLELLCKGCHTRQHCEELQVMQIQLREAGTSYLETYKRGRESLLRKIEKH